MLSLQHDPRSAYYYDNFHDKPKPRLTLNIQLDRNRRQRSSSAAYSFTHDISAQEFDSERPGRWTVQVTYLHNDNGSGKSQVHRTFGPQMIMPRKRITK
jgi:hypothetical protein